MYNETRYTNGSTERVQRLRKKHFETKASVCIDRDVIFTEVMQATESMRNEIRLSTAFKTVLENIGNPIEADELIVGAPQSRIKSVALYPELGAEWVIQSIDTIDTRPQDPLVISDEDRQTMKEKIFPYWEKRCLRHTAMQQLPPEAAMMVQFGQYLATWGEQSAGHYAPDFEYVLSTGFEAIREKARAKLETLTPLYYPNLRHRDFLKALILVCDGILAWASNYAKKARELAEKEPAASKRRKELLEIAEICEQVPAKPARTYREVCQFVFFIQCLAYTESDNQACAVLKFDQYAYPYYVADIESGRMTREEARELTECFWLKLDEILQLYSDNNAMYFPGYMPFQVVSLGGLTKDGEDAANELTYLCLEVTRDMRLRQPSVVAVFHDNSTDEFYHACVECLKSNTGGLPAFVNAEIGAYAPTIKSVMEPYEVNRSGGAMGCVGWCGSPGKTSGIDCGCLNMAQDLQRTFNNGFVKMIQMQVGPKTGDPRDFKSFDELYAAFKEQLKFTMRKLVEATLIYWRCHEEDLPQHLESLLQPSCIEKAERCNSPYNGGGAALPPGGAILPVGMGTVVNSLAVIKKFIYEEKTLTWDTLLDALDKNWEGYEDLRQMCVNKAPKYCNDDDYVDSIAVDLDNFLFDYMTGEECDPMHTEFLNPNYMAINSYVPMGLLVGATPDGRFAYDALSDNLGAANGTDRNGAVGVLNTLCKYNIKHRGGSLLNLRFTKDSIEGENEKKWINLIRSYFKNGGYHAQFNFISSETLHDAQDHPENYTDLMVRVAGFSAYFTQMAKVSQDGVIKRTEHSI